jgi:hypothetical protein
MQFPEPQNDQLHHFHNLYHHRRHWRRARIEGNGDKGRMITVPNT